MARRPRVINNKQRGRKFEAEFVETCKNFGYEAKRAWGSDGRSLGLDETVDTLIELMRGQNKRKKRLPKWLAIDPAKIDYVAFREERSPAYIAMSLELFLLLTTPERVKEFFKGRIKK